MADLAILGESDFMRASGERLRLALDALQMPQVRAAEIMGVSKSNLGNWLRGEAPIRAYALYRLCRATGITADWVLLDDPSGLPGRVRDVLLGPTRARTPAD